MALAVPEVVALSTLAFDPVEQDDNLVVIIAPEPDDEEGMKAMNQMLDPPHMKGRKPIDQPIVVLNHHMAPISGPAALYEVAYHLRLLSVQFVAGDGMPEDLQQKLDNDRIASKNYTDPGDGDARDAAVDAAMQHAQEAGLHHGETRALITRAYPRPWHVFVDTAPGTDADFDVAATFDDEPSLEEVNCAIVECLEGSEREDEIVAQQMQQALEDGQLDRVSDMLDEIGIHFLDDETEDNNEGITGDEDLWDLFDEDSV